MTAVHATLEEADEAAELDRIAWNLPRRPLTEVPRASPGSPASAPPPELAPRPTGIVPTLDPESLHADEAAVQGLDWQGFLSRYFPGRRRHDLEALTAYGAYRLEESRPNVPDSTAVDTWADDGGTTR